jgi:aspartyl-tRNA(Asn)/glutamyl-tRNA(Gln) amidotransferase subunit C
MVAFAMPRVLSREEVSAIALLANLELDPAELDLFARQLGSILDYATQVQQIDTAGVPPTASLVANQATDRSDAVGPSLEIADTLANAPDPDRTRLEGGFFKVPRVIG